LLGGPASLSRGGQGRFIQCQACRGSSQARDVPGLASSALGALARIGKKLGGGGAELDERRRKLDSVHPNLILTRRMLPEKGESLDGSGEACRGARQADRLGFEGRASAGKLGRNGWSLPRLRARFFDNRWTGCRPEGRPRREPWTGRRPPLRG